jgi:hypothetical protein
MSNQTKSAVIIVLVIVAVAGFFWLANFLGSGEKAESEKPALICKPQNAPPEKQECFWTAHIHFHLQAFKGLEELPIGFEQGDLRGIHNHADKNLVHWHGLIPVDPKTKEVTDWSAFEVQKISSDLKLSPERKPKFIVNGQEVAPVYVWKDGDHIEIHYE